EVLGGAAERGERDAARLVRKRDRHVRAARERLEERPLRPGQVLEAVGEDRCAAPRGQVGGESLRSAPAQDVAIPHAQAVELGATRGVQTAELAAPAVGPAWHDQKRLALERGQVPVAEKLDLAGVRGPDDEAERHPPIVVPGLDVLPLRKAETRGRSVKYSRGPTGPSPSSRA